ncbi:MAG: tetratricopeptide repeat protein [Candidatus Omnitrophica bacterium]|nr:tetratricopeptide repeat protein [Candidatus Omnitrophota bacterium]
MLKKFLIQFIFFLLLASSVFSSNKEDESFLLASEAFSDGFYEAGVSLFERFIESFPESEKTSQAKLYLAKSHYFKKDYSKALSILSDVASNRKSETILDEIYCWFSQVYFKKKEYEESLKFSEKVLEKYPQSKFISLANYLSASNFYELGQSKKAETIFEKIIKNTSDEEISKNSYTKLLPIYFKNGNYSAMEALGQDYIRKYPFGPLKGKIYYYIAESNRLGQNFDKALAWYHKALSVGDGSRNDSIHHNMMLTFLANGQKKQAKIRINGIKSNELRLLAEAIYYFKTKQYVKALGLLESFLKKFKNSEFKAAVYLKKADVLYEMGRINDSLSMYAYVIEEFSTSERAETTNSAYYGLAWCYLKNGEFKRAITEFKNILEYTDNSVVKISSQIQIADAYQEAKEYKAALDIYNRILKSDSKTIYADYIQFQVGNIFLKTKKFDRAALTFENLKKNFPNSKLIPQTQYYLAMVYFSREEYAQAGILLKDFTEKFSDDSLLVSVYYLYGKCFFNQKDYSSAVDIFKKTVKMLKGRVAQDKEIAMLVRIDLGNAYFNLSLFNEAKKTWKGFLRSFPRSEYSGLVALYLGDLYEMEENYKKAVKHYKIALGNFKNSQLRGEALFSLGHLYWRKGNLNEARRYLSKVTEHDTDFFLKARLYLAKINKLEGETQAAIKIYDELIATDASIVLLALLDKAHIYKQEKEYDKAIKLFNRVIENGNDSSNVIFALASCLEKVSNEQEAIKQYLKIISTSSDNDFKVKSYFRIARIHEKQNQNKEAERIYREIIKLGTKEAKIAKEKIKHLRP